MSRTVVAHHRFPDGEECVWNPKSGAYDLPLKKWLKRLKTEGKKLDPQADGKV